MEVVLEVVKFRDDGSGDLVYRAWLVWHGVTSMISVRLGFYVFYSLAPHTAAFEVG